VEGPGQLPPLTPLIRSCTGCVLPKMVAFKDPLTLDIGYPNTCQRNRARTNLLNKIRQDLGRITTVVAYTSVTLKP